MGASFKYRDGELRRAAKVLDQKLDLAVRLVVDVHSGRGEGYLKEQAPWTDRTGAARAGLHSFTEHNGDTHTIILAHSVHYGIWLEVKNSGEYQVILPVVRQTGKELMEDLNHIMRRL